MSDKFTIVRTEPVEPQVEKVVVEFTPQEIRRAYKTFATVVAPGRSNITLFNLFRDAMGAMDGKRSYASDINEEGELV